MDWRQLKLPKRDVTVLEREHGKGKVENERSTVQLLVRSRNTTSLSTRRQGKKESNYSEMLVEMEEWTHTHIHTHTRTRKFMLYTLSLLSEVLD